MTAVPRTIGRTRVEFRRGSRLSERDLQAATDHERRLHGLHVRALHDTWGVALGYETALDSERRTVRVGPGLAYDCFGQELLLADAVAIPGPAGAGRGPVVFDLVLSAADALDRVGVAARDAVCIGSLAPRAVSLRWERAGAEGLGNRLPLLAPGVRLGSEIPLGRFVRAPGGTMQGPDPSVTRRVRPLLRPHVGSGRTTAQLAQCQGLVCTLTVDTTEGGFSGTPLYFVTFAEDDPIVSVTDDLLIGPFVSVAAPGRDRFTLQMVFALRPSPITDTSAIEAKIKAGLGVARVEWLGLEPFGGCPPSPAGRWFFGLGGRLIADFDAWPGLIDLMASVGGVP